MNHKQAQEILAENGQEHLLRFWDRLDAEARKALLEQIASIDFREVARCQALLPGAKAGAPTKTKKKEPTPPEVSVLKGEQLRSSFPPAAWAWCWSPAARVPGSGSRVRRGPIRSVP